LQLPFCNFVGEELTVFGCVKEEYEKNFENHWSSPSSKFNCLLLKLVQSSLAFNLDLCDMANNNILKRDRVHSCKLT